MRERIELIKIEVKQANVAVSHGFDIIKECKFSVIIILMRRKLAHFVFASNKW